MAADAPGDAHLLMELFASDGAGWQQREPAVVEADIARTTIAGRSGLGELQNSSSR